MNVHYVKFQKKFDSGTIWNSKLEILVAPPRKRFNFLRASPPPSFWV